MNMENCREKKADAGYSALQAAEWFLAYNRARMEEEGADRISAPRLQKLLYYAQGCHLALTGRALFDDAVIATSRGPVIGSVYRKYKHYLSSGIPYDGRYVCPFDEGTENILEEVYRVFAKYSAQGLQDLIRQEDPWKETEKECEITQDRLKEYFLRSRVEK